MVLYFPAPDGDVLYSGRSIRYLCPCCSSGAELAVCGQVWCSAHCPCGGGNIYSLGTPTPLPSAAVRLLTLYYAFYLSARPCRSWQALACPSTLDFSSVASTKDFSSFPKCALITAKASSTCLSCCVGRQDKRTRLEVGSCCAPYVNEGWMDPLVSCLAQVQSFGMLL